MFSSYFWVDVPENFENVCSQRCMHFYVRKTGTQTVGKELRAQKYTYMYMSK